jgi:hypothetical protein
LTCPVFRSERDAELTKKIYGHVPVLIRDVKPGAEGNPWGVSFMAMFHMSNDSDKFRTRQELEAESCTKVRAEYLSPSGRRYMPLYEAKMTGLYDHRAASYASRGNDRGYRVLPESSIAEHSDPDYRASPYYWVESGLVEGRIPPGWGRQWLLGFNDVTTVVTERSVLPTIIPMAAVGNSLPLMFPLANVSNAQLLCLYGCLASLPFDYVARQKIGRLHLNFFIVKQFPVIPPPKDAATIQVVAPRVLELLYTAWDLKPLFDDVTKEDPGFDVRGAGPGGVPFGWNEDRRATLRAELDAWYAHLYGLTRDELRFILDPSDALGEDYPSETFRVLKKNEIARYGEYRTARLVLEAWDRLVEPARRAGGNA